MHRFDARRVSGECQAWGMSIRASGRASRRFDGTRSGSRACGGPCGCLGVGEVGVGMMVEMNMFWRVAIIRGSGWQGGRASFGCHLRVYVSPVESQHIVWRSADVQYVHVSRQMMELEVREPDTGGRADGCSASANVSRARRGQRASMVTNCESRVETDSFSSAFLYSMRVVEQRAGTCER